MVTKFKMKRGNPGISILIGVFAFFSILTDPNVFADTPLLSLEIDSSILSWQDEFVLKLSIYGPEAMDLPRVTIDGLDQFQLQGTGKNLLQIPRGKTKKWILTYTLLASDTGNFKVGPAIVTYQGRTYRSNIVFITVEPPTPRPQKQSVQEELKKPPVELPKEVKKPPVEPPKEEKKLPVEQPKEEKKPPVEPPKEEKRPPVEEPKTVKEEITPPIVLSASKVGDRILILMETRNTRPYQLQGIPVTVRLLSQLPVENLQFLDEADFPGFLRYDFPFTSKPQRRGCELPEQTLCVV